MCEQAAGLVSTRRARRRRRARHFLAATVHSCKKGWLCILLHLAVSCSQTWLPRPRARSPRSGVAARVPPRAQFALLACSLLLARANSVLLHSCCSRPSGALNSTVAAPGRRAAAVAARALLSLLLTRGRLFRASSRRREPRSPLSLQCISRCCSSIVLRCRGAGFATPPLLLLARRRLSRVYSQHNARASLPLSAMVYMYCGLSCCTIQQTPAHVRGKKAHDTTIV